MPKYWSGGFHFQISFSVSLQGESVSQVASFDKTNTFSLTPLGMQQKNLTFFLELHGFMDFLIIQ